MAELRTLSLSHSSSRRRRASTDSSSPEFEFWMVRNPSFPAPNLVSADELFVDGVLRPLHRLPDTPDPNANTSDPKPKPNRKPTSGPPAPDPEPTSEPSAVDPEPDPGPELTAAAPAATASKRWRDIFKVAGEKKAGKENDKEKEKKKERKGGGGASSAELNINIWPFARSRSAGNAHTRPKLAFGAPAATRKVNSAPCSRSNSGGESKSRKWPPASPGRGGVHLGRSSPVWQVRRGGAAGVKSVLEPPKIQNGGKGTKTEAPESGRSKKTTSVVAAAAGGGGGGAKARVLNLNVPMCIGYRSHLSCKSDVSSSTVGVGGSGIGGNNRSGGGSHGGDGVNGGAGGSLFNLRSLFVKKVY